MAIHQYRLVTLTIICLPAVLAADQPAQILDLSHWKLTLPVNSDRAGNPDEIEPRELAAFTDAQHFFVDEASRGVVFRAPCGGVTTRGSSYPRCELRELNDQGRDAAWTTDDTVTHMLSMIAAISKTPPVKKHVVCAQIHSAKADVLMVRLEGKKLFIERKPEPDVMLDAAYELGKRFELQITAGRGRIQVWHDKSLKLDWPTSREGCYFKAGCYTQSNPQRGDAADSYGEVVIYRLQLSHEK